MGKLCKYAMSCLFQRKPSFKYSIWDLLQIMFVLGREQFSIKGIYNKVLVNSYWLTVSQLGGTALVT